MNNKPIQRTIKRIIDVSVSATILLLASPVMIVIAMLIRWRMGSPVLFRQQRPGLGERPFVLYKFRTMNDAQGGDGKPLSDGERLTSLGTFLRRWSIDELPQFWNVLRGDMSLVGPRPLLMEYVERYNAEQARRLDVKPGITGWAQINGRNTISWKDKFELDVWYVDHRGLALDLRTLLITAWKVLKGEGINASGIAGMPKFTGTEKEESYLSESSEYQDGKIAA